MTHNLIQEIINKIKLPDGWDFTGEWRLPKVGDTYLSNTALNRYISSPDNYEIWTINLVTIYLVLNVRPTEEVFIVKRIDGGQT